MMQVNSGHSHRKHKLKLCEINSVRILLIREKTQGDNSETTGGVSRSLNCPAVFTNLQVAWVGTLVVFWFV